MRRFHHLSRRLALVAMLGAPLAGCGKKETPPAPVADVATPGGTAQPESALKAPADAEAKKEEAKPDTSAPADQAVPTPAGAPPERAPLSTASVAALPDGFVAVAGTPDFGALFKTFGAQVAAMEGETLPDNALEGFIASAKSEAGIDLSWFDPSKPLRFAVPDPKQHENGFLMVLAIKADAKLDAAMFPGATAGVDGHWAKVDFQGRELWLDQVDGFLVAASDKSFAKDQEAFVKSIIAWTPAAPLVLDTSVGNLRKTFADELANAKQVAEAIAGMAADPSNPGQGDQIRKMADLGFALVEGLDRLGLAYDPTGDFPRAAVTLTGAAESPIGKFAAQIKDKKASYGLATPADAWLALGYDVPNAGYLSNIDQLVDQITSKSENPMAPQLNEDEKKELKAKLTALMELQGTQSASWIRQQGDLPLIFEGISDSPDAKNLHDALLDVGDFLFKKVFVQLRKQMLTQGVPADQVPESMGFGDFIGFFNKNAGMMGISLQTGSTTSDKGAKASGLEVGINWSKLPLRDEAAIVAKLLGDKVGFAFAGLDKTFAFAFGPDATKRAAGLADAGAPTANADAWMSGLAQKPVYLMMRPARLLKVLATHVPKMAEAKGQIDALADDPLVLTGTSDGTTVAFELTLSKRHVDVLKLLE